MGAHVELRRLAGICNASALRGVRVSWEEIERALADEYPTMLAELRSKLVESGGELLQPDQQAAGSRPRRHRSRKRDR